MVVFVHPLVLIATVIVATCDGLAANPTTRPIRHLGTGQTARVLHSTVEESTIREWLPRLAEARPYQKLAAADALAKQMRPNVKIEMVGYRRQPGGQDLSCAAGRSAFVIQELLHIQLPPATADQNNDQIEAIQDQARTAIKAYRQALMDSVREPRRERSVKELTEAYKGKIKIGLQTFAQGDASFWAMMDLFDEWPPIGRRMADLRAILGSDGEVQGGSRLFRIVETDGLTGTEFEIVEKDGLIVSVILEGIY